jgi:hypothetical protein
MATESSAFDMHSTTSHCFKGEKFAGGSHASGLNFSLALSALVIE